MMKVMRERYLVALLVATALLAGCTQLGPEDSSEVPTQGIVVEEARILDPEIKQGRSTQLVVRVENTNPTPVTDFRAEVSNTGDVDVSMIEGTGRCSGGTLPAAEGGVPTSVLCAWKLDTGNVDLSVGDKNFPIGVTLTYSSRLTMEEESMKFFFAEEDVQQRTKLTSFDNREVRVIADHPTELYANEEQEISVFVTVENVGEGSIVDDRVDLTYSGSLLEDSGFVREGGLCGTAEFLGQQQSTTIECIIKGSEDTPRTEHDLRISADYTYKRYLPMSLRVFE